MCCHEGTCAVVCKFADAVQAEVHNLLANGVVAAGKVVGSVLLAADELLGVEQLAVCAGPDLINYSGLQGRQGLACRAMGLSLKVQQDRRDAKPRQLPAPLAMAHAAAWLLGELIPCESPAGDTRTHLQVKKHAARDVLASASLGEKGVEGVVATSDGLV